MIYNYKEILSKYNTDYNIKKALNNKDVYKIAEGVYSDNSNVSFLALVTKKYPYGIISGLSAYYFYGFTDVIPDKIEMTTPQNTTRIKDSDIKQIRMKEDLYNLGITNYLYEGVVINIYNKERLLIDLARNKNNIPYDLYKELVNKYRQEINNIDMNLVEKYLSHFSDSNRIYKILMSEVF